MELLCDRFHGLIEKALGEFEGARNPSTKADGIVLLQQTLMVSNMYMDYLNKSKHFGQELQKVQTTERVSPLT